MTESKFPRSTKIVATIGTATDDPDIIKKLIKTGVNVFRLNFSHGNHGDHLKRITNIRFNSWLAHISLRIRQEEQDQEYEAQDIFCCKKMLPPDQ